MEEREFWKAICLASGKMMDTWEEKKLSSGWDVIHAAMGKGVSGAHQRLGL